MPAITPPLFDGRQTIAATEDSITVNIGAGAVGATVVNGNYYLRSHSAGGDTDQLLERFLTAVNSVAGAGAVTGAFDAETGLVTLTETNGNNTTIVFSDHAASGDIDVGVMLGLIQPTAGASPSILVPLNSTFTGVREPYYIWRPNRAPATQDGALDRLVTSRADARVTRSASGRTVGTMFFTHMDLDLRFEWLDVALVHMTDSTATANSYEAFWARILTTHIPIRYYRERGDWNGPTGGGPLTVISDESTAQSGTSPPRVTRGEEYQDDWWHVRCSFHLYVSS